MITKYNVIAAVYSLYVKTEGGLIVNIIKLADTWSDVVEFEHHYTVFKKDTKVRDFLNKIFDASLVAVYTQKKHDLSKGSLDWSGENIITVSKSGKVVWMTNSEWSDFQCMK